MMTNNDGGISPDDRDEFLDDFGLEELPPVEVKRPEWHSDPRVGFFPDMTDEEYFGDPVEECSLNGSGIKILESESPLDFAYQAPRINPDAIASVLETVAGRRGDIVHQLALGKGRGYAIGDFKDWRTKAAGEFKAEALERGETPILLKQFEEAEVMAEVVKDRIDEVVDGEPYETEVAIIWCEETPSGLIYMRGRLDVWCPSKGIILDPKITALLGNGRPFEEKINRHMVSMGWDRQAGLYTRGVERLMPELEGRVRFGNLLIKPEAPFTSRLMWPDNIAKRTAVAECRPTIFKFAECLKAGRWPGYPKEGETLSLPSFIENRRLEAEIHA